jgi:hypothetical protein
MSTFKVAGVSKLDGKFKVRFANDMLRVKVLEKNNHTQVDLVEFVTPLTKEKAVAKLIEMDFAKGDAAIQAALDEASEKRTVAPKVAKAPKAKAASKAKSKPSLDAIAARAKATKPAVTKADVTKQLEDAPY